MCKSISAKRSKVDQLNSGAAVAAAQWQIQRSNIWTTDDILHYPNMCFGKEDVCSAVKKAGQPEMNTPSVVPTGLIFLAVL